MKVSLVVSALVGTVLANSHCPSVFSTGSVCTTCTQNACLAISTISNPCDCPPVPTIRIDYPCESGCPKGLCAGTSYVSDTSSSSCPPTGCPTVTKTTNTCPTCPVQKCIKLETVSQGCDCPSEPKTSYISESCVSGCPDVWCESTSYVTVPATGCGTPFPTITTPPTPPTHTTEKKCVPTVTVSEYPSSGCKYNCTTGCIMDKFVTLPCGCSNAASVVTKTESLPCATTSNCWQCHTGFPWTTTATDCPTYCPAKRRRHITVY